MKCSICRNGETRLGEATVSLERGATTGVVKKVPAQVCGNCGEYYLSEDVTASVLALTEDAVKRGAEVEVVRFVA